MDLERHQLWLGWSIATPVGMEIDHSALNWSWDFFSDLYTINVGINDSQNIPQTSAEPEDDWHHLAGARARVKVLPGSIAPWTDVFALVPGETALFLTLSNNQPGDTSWQEEVWRSVEHR